MDKVWLQEYVNSVLPKTFTEDEIIDSCLSITNEFNKAFNNNVNYISKYNESEKVLYLPRNFQLAFELTNDNKTIHVGILKNANLKKEDDINFNGSKYYVVRGTGVEYMETLQEVIEYMIKENIYKYN